MSRLMLDTNIASDVIKGDRPEVVRRLAVLPLVDVAISVVTEGELLYGLAKRAYPVRLSERVRQFLLRVEILPWDRPAAQAYADLRAACEARGVSLGSLDTMIAAHAVATASVLVTRARGFARAPAPLKVEYWTTSRV